MAKKMVLVDPRTLQAANEPVVPDGLSDVLRRLDGEMEGILRNPSLRLSDKVTRYNEVLGRYLSKTREYENVQRAPLEQLSGIRDSVKHVSEVVEGVAAGEPSIGPVNNPFPAAVGERGNESELLGLVSKTYRPKAGRLFSFLKSIPDVSWTDRGELQVGRQVFRGSHIVDLVSKSVKPPRWGGAEPTGWRAFVNLLRKWNVPLDLLSGGLKRDGGRVESEDSEGEDRVVSGRRGRKRRVEGGAKGSLTPPRTPPSWRTLRR